MDNFLVVQNKKKVGSTIFRDQRVVVQVERKEITFLKGTGKEIWNLCTKLISFKEIVKRLSSLFPDAKTLEEDTHRFLNDLVKKDLLLEVQ